MVKKTFWLLGLSVLLAVGLPPGAALAHESITVGDYTLVVGWLNEPPIAGQHNAIVVEVSNTGDEEPMEDISTLTLTVSYGGQEKVLVLEPVDAPSPGRFMAPILPTTAGEYSVIFGGSLGDTPVEAETHVEEVQPADTLAFPAILSDMPEPASFGITEWIALAGLASGLAALILSLVNRRKGR